MSGVQFGTSGARGLTGDLTDQVCYLLALGFLQHTQKILGRKPASIALAGDLRPSTDGILRAVSKAVGDFGSTGVFCGHIPTPTLALYGMTEKNSCLDDYRKPHFRRPQWNQIFYAVRRDFERRRAKSSD